MAVMGLISRIRGRLRHSGTKADKLSELANHIASLEREMTLLKGRHDAEVRYRMENDAWGRVRFLEKHLGLRLVDEPAREEWVPPRTYYTVTTAAKNDPETKPEVQKNATRKEWQNHGE